VARRLHDVELILHAGDVCIPSVLDELSAYAPVRAVLGNNDGPEVAAWGATPTLEFDVAGVAVAMIHDSGPATGRAARLRRLVPSAGVVVFGHSHIPWDETFDGQRAFNPGSATERRRQPHTTMGLLDLHAGELRTAELIRLD
jgi:putative phosphoesterase